MRRVGVGRVLFALGLLWSTAATAQAPAGTQVRWDTETTCIEPSDLLERIAFRLGIEPAQLARKLIRLEVRVVRELRELWNAKLLVVTNAGTSERYFEAESCQAIIQGTAFVAALAFDSRSGARLGLKLPLAEPPVRFVLRVPVSLEFGVLPQPSTELGLAAGVMWSTWRIELQVTHGFAQHKTVDATTGAGADLEARLAGGVRGCYIPWQRRVELGACATAEVAWLHARGTDLPAPWGSDAYSLTLLGGVTAAYRVWRGVGLRAEAAIGGNAVRPSFAIDGLGEVHRPAAVAGRLLVGVELWLR